MVLGFFNLTGYGIKKTSVQWGKLWENKTSEGNRSLGSLHPCYHRTSYNPVPKHVGLHPHCCVHLSSGASNGRVSQNLTPQLVITLLVFSLKCSWAIYSHLVLPTLSCLLNSCFCLPSDHTLMYWQTAYIFAAPTLLKLNKLTQFVSPHKKIICLLHYPVAHLCNWPSLNCFAPNMEGQNWI